MACGAGNRAGNFRDKNPENQMTIKLHCFGESGNAYKAALPLELSGLDWEPVFVDFFNGETRSAEFRELNPMGEAPVMVDGALVLSQSGAIQHYIVEQTGQFGGDTESDRRDILRWVLWDNHKNSSYSGLIRFLMNFVPAESRPQQVIDWLQGRVKRSWETLEAELAERDWLVGNKVSIADFSCCGYLYYPEPFGFDRADWPAVARWLDRIAGLDGWKHPYDLMPGRPSDRENK